MIFMKSVIVISLTALISGCGGFLRSVDSVGKWDADPITKPYPEDVDLLVLLTANSESAPAPASAASNISYGQKLEKALADAEVLDDEKYKAKRRIVTEALIRKSNMLCQDYKLTLVRRQARGNFLLGTTSLLLGTAGAIATQATTARALSGGAAFATGTQSEINQDFFFDKTASVISKAIDKRRAVQLQLIKNNVDASKQIYSFRGAIADVEDYHATCSITGAVAELERAVDSIDVYKSVEAATNVAAKYNKMRVDISSKSGPVSGTTDVTETAEEK